jgi:hypothetical protein
VLLFPCSGDLDQVSLLAEALRAAAATPGARHVIPNAPVAGPI